MPFKILLFAGLFCCAACQSHPIAPVKDTVAEPAVSLTDENPYPAVAAIPLPAGYHRLPQSNDSFGDWLRHVTLKKNKLVYKYDGSLKGDQSAQFAVLDISVGDKNLQQCADAVMRLRAEYLFAAKRYADINFSDNAGTRYLFTQPYTHEHLLQYLERVFGMCGTASLAKQMHPAGDPLAVQPGDVLVRGGFPGHAVIVMDVAENDTGERIYLLAQGYMPAQDIHLLKNPADADLSPWYQASGAPTIFTPEYTFMKNEWRSW